MKTHVQLWPRICTFENLYRAWLETRRGKSTKRQAVHFECQLEEHLCTLLDELRSGAYQPGSYTSFYVWAGVACLQCDPVKSTVVLANGLNFIFE
jgi:hypothetical protein